VAVLSPNHHSRHLQSDEEKAQFQRTAPIEAPGYWDLADEVSRADANPEAIQIRYREVETTLEQRAVDGKDEAILHVSAETMKRVISTAIREY
jgi:hypothetical protein